RTSTRSSAMRWPARSRSPAPNGRRRASPRASSRRCSASSSELARPMSIAQSASEAFVRLAKVGKSFRAESGTLEVLRNVSIDVADRQFISILGPSGCGKSTLLMMLAGLEPVSSGSIEIAGEAMRRPRRDVGVIFQDPTLLPWKSALENVLFPIEIYGLP